MSLAIAFSCHPIDRMILISSTPATRRFANARLAGPAKCPPLVKQRRNVSNKVRQSCVASPRYLSNAAKAGREYGPGRKPGFYRRMNFGGTSGRACGADLPQPPFIPWAPHRIHGKFTIVSDLSGWQPIWAMHFV